MIRFPFSFTTTNPTDVDAPFCALTSIDVSERVNDRHSNTLSRFPINGLTETIIDENELTHPSLTIRPFLNTLGGVSPIACRTVDCDVDPNTLTFPDVNETLSLSEKGDEESEMDDVVEERRVIE
jgi:hypothetical protein